MATAPIGGQRPIQPRSTPRQGKLGNHKVDRLKSAGLSLSPQKTLFKGKIYDTRRTFSGHRGALASDRWLDRNPNAADGTDITKDIAPRIFKNYANLFSRPRRK